MSRRVVARRVVAVASAITRASMHERVGQWACSAR